LNNDDRAEPITTTTTPSSRRPFPGGVGAALRGNSFSTQTTTKDELVAIQIVHRHGARSPLHPSPTKDGWDTIAPKYAVGQLTTRGMAMHEAFGKKLKTEYGPFVSNFGNSDVYVRSSDVNRCLLSVQSLLAGLWPDQRIPIHTILEDSETLLQPTDKCAAYKSMHSLVVKRWSQVAIKQLPDLLEKLKDITGFGYFDDPNVDSTQQLSAEAIVKAGNLISIAVDTAACSSTQGVQLDPYFTDSVIQVLRNFTKQMYFEQYGMDYTNRSLTDPRGPAGVQLMRHILATFIAKSKETAKSSKIGPKLTIFSAHDTTLVALASSLGLLQSPNDHLLPPFAASMVFELRRKVVKVGSDAYNYYVTARYGHPEAVDGGDLESAAGWTYVLESMPINCPTLMTKGQCLLDDWESYIEKHNPVSSGRDGCCTRTRGFYELGCDNYTRPYAELPSECQMYRRTCPVSSCGEAQVLSAESMSCVDTSVVNCDTEPSMTHAIGVGFLSAGALLGLAALISRIRHNKAPTVRSLDGSVQYAPVLTLRR